MKRHVLILSQVIPQWYVDVLTNSLGKDVETVFVTGSDVNANVVKAPEYNPTNFVTRVITWINYFLFAYKWARKHRTEKYDLIFSTSNPPINSFLGIRFKKIFKAPFIMMNWDIYPQCIDYMIKKPVVHLVCKLWHHFNNKNYHQIDKIATIGDVVAESINEPLKNKIDISVISIGVDTQSLIPREKNDNFFCKEHNLQDKFVVIYSGKMGYGHNIELILETAKKLSSYEEIKFVFIGSGQKYITVEKFCENSENNNVLLLPYQPDEVFAYSMACGDVGIVTEENEMARFFMPSKTYSMISCGMPVIGICSDYDDLHNLIENKGIGLCVTDNNVETLSSYILDLYKDKAKLTELKAIARDCAVKDYDIKKIEQQYSELFEQYLQKKREG